MQHLPPTVEVGNIHIRILEDLHESTPRISRDPLARHLAGRANSKNERAHKASRLA